MAQIAKNVMKQLGLSFPIEIVSFDQAPERVKENSNMDVMISRGLMIDLMSQYTDLPLVGLTMTIDELLESVQRLTDRNATKIGVVAHSGFLEIGKSDFVVGEVSIYVRPWDTLEDIPEILEQLSFLEIDAISGDKGGSTVAEEKGYIVDLLESGELAISRAIREALRISRAQQREREKEAERTQNIQTVISRLYSDLEESAASIEELTASSQELAASSQESTDIVLAVAQEMKSVFGALTMIQTVAKQSNLLGLNAAIEAARAGEHGQGFSVVAQEISKLAEMSNSSAKNIDGMLKDFQDSVFRVQRNVEQGNIITQEQAKATQLIAEKLETLREIGGQLTDLYERDY